MEQKTGATIVAVCVSEVTGTAKKPVRQCRMIAGRGIENDGHIDTIRPVSILMRADIDEYNAGHEQKAGFGDFAENLVVDGLNLRQASVGDHIKAGATILEICQIGKEVAPHHYSFNGDRLLPGKGIFCRVLVGGMIAVGCSVELIRKRQ